MKKLLVLLVIFTTFVSMAQSVGINADGTTANASAMLDVKSTTKGFLPPRMTTTQRDVLTPTASVGLVIFNTTTSSLEYNTATGWVSCKSNPDGTATGQMQYWNGSNWVNITIGSNGQVLKYNSNVPAWSTVSTVPDPPTIGTATRGDLQATVTFTPPSNNGGNAITSYTVFSNPLGRIAKGSGSPITITGLTQSTNYNFEVTATNSTGTSLASSMSNNVLVLSSPNAPTNVSATKGEDSKSTVTFTAPTNNGGSAITGYTITSNPGGISATGSSSPIVITGLSNGTIYTFTVKASNTIGQGATSISSNSVMPYTLQSLCGSTTVTFNYNGASATYGVVIGTNYKCWLDRNLGASRVAISSSDAASFGDLFQWGRGADGHQLRTSTTTNILSSSDVPGNSNFIISTNPANSYDWRSPQNSNLWQGVNGVNNVCPSGYRLPTGDEFANEYNTWFVYNYNGAYASPLKLPVAGSRSQINGTIDLERGQYWTSGTGGDVSIYLGFRIDSAFTGGTGRGGAYSVRCIKD